MNIRHDFYFINYVKLKQNLNTKLFTLFGKRGKMCIYLKDIIIFYSK